MHNILTILGSLRVRRFPGLCFLAILLSFIGPSRLPAQQKENLAPPACTPSDLSALIVREGNSVRVSSVEEPSFRSASNQNTRGAVDNFPSSMNLHAQAEAYKTLEKEALRGSVAAQVNLAVASLAGWGTPPNAGTALYWFHVAGGKGYSPALFDLGILYSRGCGVTQDYAEAFRYFQAAANSGNMAAALNLGYLYDQGLGVNQDHTEAARWYRQAAERGVAKAQYNLADLYLRGAGIPMDESLAFSWFQKAALQGHSGACIMLGAMLAAGRGARQDLQSAYLWLSVATLQGDSRGDATLQLLEQQLTPAQMTAAKNKARSLLRSNLESPEFARQQ